MKKIKTETVKMTQPPEEKDWLFDKVLPFVAWMAVAGLLTLGLVNIGKAAWTKYRPVPTFTCDNCKHIVAEVSKQVTEEHIIQVDGGKTSLVTVTREYCQACAPQHNWTLHVAGQRIDRYRMGDDLAGVYVVHKQVVLKSPETKPDASAEAKVVMAGFSNGWWHDDGTTLGKARQAAHIAAMKLKTAHDEAVAANEKVKELEKKEPKVFNFQSTEAGQ